MVPSDVTLLFASLIEKGISAGLVSNLSSNFGQVGDKQSSWVEGIVINSCLLAVLWTSCFSGQK